MAYREVIDLVMDLKKIAVDIRKKILKMHFNAQSSHIGSSLSCVEIMVSLYFGILRIDPKNPLDANRDRFLLSKGHAASVLYATLARRGFFDKSLLENYCCDGGLLPGHCCRNSVPAIEVSTGSLGHGLPMGIGMALAAKHDRQQYRTFVLLSDGECDEGSVWESAMFAGHYKLDNLIAIVDYNKIQAFRRTEEVLNLEPFADKWKAFGWEVKEIDGHNFSEIIETLKGIPFKNGKPNIIIAHTVKGKGISFMENKLVWHYNAPNESEFKIGLQELNSQ